MLRSKTQPGTSFSKYLLAIASENKTQTLDLLYIKPKVLHISTHKIILVPDSTFLKNQLPWQFLQSMALQHSRHLKFHQEEHLISLKKRNINSYALTKDLLLTYYDILTWIYIISSNKFHCPTSILQASPPPHIDVKGPQQQGPNQSSCLMIKPSKFTSSP